MTLRVGPFSIEEDQTIRKHAGKLSSHSIGRLLNRRPESVRARAGYMGVSLVSEEGRIRQGARPQGEPVFRRAAGATPDYSDPRDNVDDKPTGRLLSRPPSHIPSASSMWRVGW